MKPRIIILDEPTSMLDPLGKDFIFEILTTLKHDGNLTIIAVEHNIEQIAPLSDIMILMYDGHIARMAPPSEFFEDSQYLEGIGAQPPMVTSFIDKLRRENLYARALPVDLEGAVQATRNVLTHKVE